MKWLMEKLFGKEEPLRVYSTAQRTPEQEAMFQLQKSIKDALGMEHSNDHQNWLKLHQILLDHEERLKALEGK